MCNRFRQYRSILKCFVQGLFGIPELRTHEGFYLLKENVIEQSDRLIEEAISPNRTRKMVEVFDELSDSLCKVADMAEFVRLAHPVSAYCQAAEDACISVSGVVEKFVSIRHRIYSQCFDWTRTHLQVEHPSEAVSIAEARCRKR